MTHSHWSSMARLWHRVGPPLRPSKADIAVYQETIVQWSAIRRPANRALILGVTPELRRLAWPAGASIFALDGSPQMIRAAWAGSRHEAALGAWTAMPFSGNAFDISVCDGGIGMLSYPHGQATLLRELHRVVRPGGIFIARLFSPSGKTGTVAEVFVRLREKRIPSLDSLKLQLWGALHHDAALGVRPRDVVARILEEYGGFEELALAQGWPMDHVLSLELHRESEATYFLTEPGEFARLAAETAGGFRCLAIRYPETALGNCSPVVVLERI